MPSEAPTQTRNLACRDIFLRFDSIDETGRSVEAVLATENPTLIEDFRSGRLVQEVLLMSGCQLPAQLPLLSAHQRSTLDDLLGSVRNIRREQNQLVGRLYFAADQPSEAAWQKVRSRHLTDLSVGYASHESIEVRPGTSAVIDGRTFTAGSEGLLVTTRWQPKEASLVPVGADPNAKTRSHAPSTQGDSMYRFNDLAQSLLCRAGIIEDPGRTDEAWLAARDLTLVGCLKRELQARNLPVPRDALELFRRAVSSGSVESIGSAVEGAILTGYTQTPDTTVGWVAEAPLNNFKNAYVFTLSDGTKLTLQPRAAGAETAGIVVPASGWRAHRFSRRLVLGEDDLYDDITGASALQAAKMLGAAARQLRPDLVYSILLANPDLDLDDTPIFHADHNNTATGALDAAALAAGLAAVGRQVATDEAGEAVHLNLRPRHLLVPPTLAGAARGVLAGLRLGQAPDLQLRVESRLDDIGLVDPLDNQKRTGTTTQWFLAAGASAHPSLVIGYVGGERTPTIARHETKGIGGVWNIEWTAIIDVACVAIDYKGLYRSDGTI